MTEKSSIAQTIFPFQLLVSVLVLRSLIATTKTPVRSTIKPSVTQNDSRTPTVHAPSPKGLVPDVGKPLLSKPPSTWVDVRLVNKRGFYLIMFENGTIAGSWKRFLTTRYGMNNLQIKTGPTDWLLLGEGMRRGAERRPRNKLNQSGRVSLLWVGSRGIWLWPSWKLGYYHWIRRPYPAVLVFQ